MILAGLLMVFFSVYTVTRTKPLDAVFGRMALSTVAVLLFVLASAFDVAIVEALLGVFLSTFLYITVFKRVGTVRVGFIPTEGLFEKHAERYSGKVYEILIKFVKEYKYELQLVEYEDFEEMCRALREDYISIAFGPVETSILPELQKNFLIFQMRSFEEKSQVMLIEKSGELSDRFFSFYERLSDSGALKDLGKK